MPTFKMQISFTELLDPNVQIAQFNSRVDKNFTGQNIETLAEGIKHIKYTKYYNKRPVKLNVIVLNQKIAKDYEIKPVIASTTLAHKQNLSKMAQNSDALIAINGGFFKPQTGVPLGTLMIDNKIYTGPIYDRVAIGFGENSYETGRVQLNATLSANGKILKVDNINQPRTLSSHIIIYTPEWGKFSPLSPKYGTQLRVENNKITKASANPLEIPANGYVLVGPKSELSKFYGIEDVKLEITTSPKWQNIKHIIGGGPYLVKNGEIFIDTTEEKLKSITGRNPRTAIGYTKENDLILITADGRENSSIGLTLEELAYYMKGLGCVSAINLDGGGSSVMYVNGKIVNQPQRKGGIALSNALVISKRYK